MTLVFAHAGHNPTEASAGLIDTIAHQPIIIALLVCLFLLAGWFGILGLFRLKLISKLLALVPVIIGLAILFMTHNPVMSTILLSGGFVMVFLLAFLLLRTGK